MENIWQEEDFCKDYLDGVEISTSNPHYGYLALGEKELRLLGPRLNLKGKRILEVCCGTGENSIAFSKWGAKCTAIDMSEVMIKKAIKLAQKEGVSIDFIIGNAANSFGEIRKINFFDFVFSSYGIVLIPEFKSTLSQLSILLKSGGKLVFCGTHPLQFPEESQEVLGSTWSENYLNITQMIGVLEENRFIVERVVEQSTKFPISLPEKEKYPYRLKNISLKFNESLKKPHTIIYVCKNM